jgi:hypothetical protein
MLSTHYYFPRPDYKHVISDLVANYPSIIARQLSTRDGDTQASVVRTCQAVAAPEPIRDKGYGRHKRGPPSNNSLSQ